MSRYYRVGPSIWDEPWTDDQRYMAVYLLTCRHRNTEGLYRLPMSYVVEDLGWTAKRVAKAFDALVECGFVMHDPDARVVFIVKAPDWQGSKNSNQITGGVRAIREVPPSRLDEPFLKAWESVSKDFAKELRKDSAKRFEYSPSPSPSPSLTEGGGSKDAARDLPTTTPSNVEFLDGRGQRESSGAVLPG